MTEIDFTQWNELENEIDSLRCDLENAVKFLVDQFLLIHSSGLNSSQGAVLFTEKYKELAALFKEILESFESLIKIAKERQQEIFQNQHKL